MTSLTKGRKGGKKNNREIRDKHIQEVFDHLEKKGFSTAKCISKEIGVSVRRTYDVLNEMIDRFFIIKEGSKYCLSEYSFIQSMIEESHRYASSLQTYRVKKADIYNHLEKEYKPSELDVVKKYGDHVIPNRHIIMTESELWTHGLYVGIFNTGININDLDFEVFLAVKHLISTILKKATIKEDIDTKISINIFFDIPTVMERLYEYKKKQIPPSIDWMNVINMDSNILAFNKIKFDLIQGKTL